MLVHALLFIYTFSCLLTILTVGNSRILIGVLFQSLRPSSHENAIVPFRLHSNFWNGQIDRSHGNGTIAYQFCFAFRRERNRSVDTFSICLFRRERNGMIAYRSTFRITFFSRSTSGKERFYLKYSRLNAALQRSTFRNNTERSGTIAFPCERGLRAE